MSRSKPYIGSKISLISKAEIRYEGTVHTIDTKNSIVSLAQVQSFGTEDRPTDYPVPPQDEVFEYIIFRRSAIKELILHEPPKPQCYLLQDPAIIQFSLGSSTSSFQSADSYGPFGRMPTYSQFSPSSLGGEQFGGVGVAGSSLISFGTETSNSDTLYQTSALGFGFTQDTRSLNMQLYQGPSSPLFDLLRKSPTMEQAVQIPSANLPAPAPVGRLSLVSTRPLPSSSQKTAENQEHRQAEVHNVSRPENEQLRNDSKRQVAPEDKLEKQKKPINGEGKGDLGVDTQKSEGNANEENPLGPNCYYDKTKSFFDNISCGDNTEWRLTRAEERRLNAETFGTPLRPNRGRGKYRGRGGVRFPKGRRRGSGRGGAFTTP
ncbi:protein LSM14 homolog A-like isoform X3 [Eulemur rufifrons]|uniref:protein LSM14 homolog A-like isoform X3 n=1 Tax=Eulemur rufifrons TaxID=859984 RepID=UPI0037440146